MAQKVPVKGKIKTELSKAVKNIKKHIESGSLGPKAAQQDSKVTSPPSTQKEGLKGRGIVYLSHIPHGFYEKEMHGFFSQFGRVTRLRLVRSHKTGNSCGYAFIEFLFSEVAQVVAETMNNYLMRNRLLKAQYIPSEKQTTKMFLHSKDYGPETCLGLLRRRRTVKAQNKPLSDEKAQAVVNRQKEKLQKLQEKLKAQGVDFLFQVDNSTNQTLVPKKPSSKPSQTPVKESSGKVPPVKESSGKVPPVKESSGKEVTQGKKPQLNKKKKEKVQTKNSSQKNKISKKVNAKTANVKTINTKIANSKIANAKIVNAKKIANSKNANSKPANSKPANSKTANAKSAHTKIAISKTLSTKAATAKKGISKHAVVKTASSKKLKAKKAAVKEISGKKISVKKITPKKVVPKKK